MEYVVEHSVWGGIVVVFFYTFVKRVARQSSR